MGRKLLAINPTFKLLVWINLVLCAATFALMIALSFWGANPLSKPQEQLFSTAEKVFTLTAGAFIGLLGGRAAAPDQDQGPAKPDRPANLSKCWPARSVTTAGTSCLPARQTNA